jgi:tetratricopeptide (TPR) repeat protein
MRVLPPLLAAVSRRGQPQRVLVLARWGVTAVDALAPTPSRTRLRIELLEAAADASDRLGQREEQRRWLDKLAELSLSPETDMRSRETLVRIYLLHGRYAAGTGQYGLARGYFRQAVQLARGLNAESELPSEALRRLSAVQEHVGALAEARELAQNAFERARHDPQRAVALLQVALIQLIEDEIEPALLSVDQALRHLRHASEWNLPGVFAAAHMLRGRIYRIAGRPARALGAIQHAVRLAVQAGERRLEAEAIARMGGLLLDLGRAEEAEARLREALLIASEIEDRRGQALAGVWLGILLWEADNPEAQSRLAQAARLAEETGLERVEALCLAILARIARAAGRMEQALDDARRAQAISLRVGAELFDLIVIAGTLALVLRTAGEESQARDIERDVARRVRRVNQRFTDPLLRQQHKQASERLIEAVLSPEGVIYPRVGPAPAPGSAL